ncbi:MAG: bifunctional folylpolyglutamate synthase/dihydrofolate synthase [Bacteroidota bacterium]|nr:bifunctional folylpolyglutamate synthase/dihydrofolate synthase [Bacteroidota bacterium]
MFHRVGPAAYKPDLSNTIAICNALGNPENKLRAVHIAGTNGKGSTSHLLAAVLQEAGYKTGLYTSPHLKDFRERIRINGKMIPKTRVVKFVADHKKLFEKVQPSFFEWTVGLAFDYFAKEKTDIAIIETGLGGRLDSTNVITPLVSVITNISLDHTNLLGKTLKKIAAEKAGIIKPGIPVVIGETQQEVKSVFEKKAKAEKSPLRFADEEFQLANAKQAKTFPLMLSVNVKAGKNIVLKNLHCGLPGFYQQKNIVTVLSAIDSLRECGFIIPEKAIRKGFKNVIALTGLQGRWQVIAKKPLTIVDTGHNEAGIKEVVAQLKKTPHKKLHIVFGVVNDKDPSRVLALLPKNATYYFCKADLPRSMNEAELAQKAGKHGLAGKNYSSVKKALKSAQTAALQGDMVFVGGSTFVVAEAI